MDSELTKFCGHNCNHVGVFVCDDALALELNKVIQLQDEVGKAKYRIDHNVKFVTSKIYYVKSIYDGLYWAGIGMYTSSGERKKVVPISTKFNIMSFVKCCRDAMTFLVPSNSFIVPFDHKIDWDGLFKVYLNSQIVQTFIIHKINNGKFIKQEPSQERPVVVDTFVYEDSYYKEPKQRIRLADCKIFTGLEYNELIDVEKKAINELNNIMPVFQRMTLPEYNRILVRDIDIMRPHDFIIVELCQTTVAHLYRSGVCKGKIGLIRTKYLKAIDTKKDIDAFKQDILLTKKIREYLLSKRLSNENLVDVIFNQLIFKPTFKDNLVLLTSLYAEDIDWLLSVTLCISPYAKGKCPLRKGRNR